MKLIIILILLTVFFVNSSQLSFGQSDGVSIDYAYIENGNFLEVKGSLSGDVEKSGLGIELIDKNGNVVEVAPANADINGNFEVMIQLPYNTEIGDYKIITKSNDNAVVISVSKTIDAIIPSFDSRMLKSFQIKCETAQNLEDVICGDLSLSELVTTLQTINNDGCLIATATFGTELAPQVQMLREIRDNSLLQTDSGSAFMKSFNKYYYTFAPTIAQWENESPVFKEIVRITITPLIASLSLLQHVSMDSEESVLGYGISLIILNLTMYVGVPTSVIIGIKRKLE